MRLACVRFRPGVVLPLVGLLCGAASAAAQPTSPAPKLVFAFEAHVQLGTPMELGQVPRGRRRIIPIVLT